MHHLCDLGRKWLNMVSTDTCNCIHQHYYSRMVIAVIADLLFCLFVWIKMKPVDEDINWMATECITATWTHQLSAVKTAFTNRSTATAQMLRPVKVNITAKQRELVVVGFFWPISPTRINVKSSATIINKNTIYCLLIYHTLNTCFGPPGHLDQVECEEDRQRLQPAEPWIALTVTIRQTLSQNLHQQTVRQVPFTGNQTELNSYQ